MRRVAWQLDGEDACHLAIALAAPIVALRGMGIKTRVDGGRLTITGPVGDA